MVNGQDRLRVLLSFRLHSRYGTVLILLPILALSLMAAACAQSASSAPSQALVLRGVVLDPGSRPVPDALVRLEAADTSAGVREVRTNSDGSFTFTGLAAGTYRITTRDSAHRSGTVTTILGNARPQEMLRLVLDKPVSPPVMEFSDQPTFTISGVTDWTAVGGHGSDSMLRTSESLTRETLSLQPGGPAASSAQRTETEQTLRASLAQSPGGFSANHQLGAFYLHAGRYREAIPLLESAYRIDPADSGNTYDLALACEGLGDLRQARAHVSEFLARHDSADLHRLAGELDEKSNDPLGAVRQFEQAAREDPSEQNYFEWGSELLLHRAIWQALEVLQKGVEAWPHSSRMLTALGTALFAGARYDDAASRLCAASDLNPADSETYRFMGKIEIAAPNPLPCIAPRLDRFVQQQPASSLANYLDAMALLKRQQPSPDPETQQRAEALLRKAVALDAGNADAWLQLGILNAGRHQYAFAIPLYLKAIDANPESADAHYRLAVAYDRTGQADKAHQEFQLHDQFEKQQAETVERQRKEIKQFLVVQPPQAGATPPALQ